MSMQLDSETFQDVMFAAHKPLVVITTAPQAKLTGAADRMRSVAQAWKDSRGSDAVVFTWMDSDKWASWLKSMYGIKADASAHVVVTNHSVSGRVLVQFCSKLVSQRLIYYDVDQLGEKLKLSPTSIISTLEGALAGTIPYKNSENIVERSVRVSVLTASPRCHFADFRSCSTSTISLSLLNTSYLTIRGQLACLS